MSLLHDGAFMDHLEQSKLKAKQQVNSMIDAIYAKLLLDLQLWLDKQDCHEVNDSSVQQLEVDHTMQFAFHDAQKISENINNPLSLLPCHLQSHSNDITVKSEIDFDCEENATDHNLPGNSQFEQSTDASNDHLTNTQDHQNNLQNEVSLSNTIKQEFDDEEIDDDNVVNCEKEICTFGDDAEMGENVDETKLNVDALLENTQTTQSIISNYILASPSPTNPINTEPLVKQQCLQGSSITSIPLNFTNNAARNDISIDEQIGGQNTQNQTDDFDDNGNQDEVNDHINTLESIVIQQNENDTNNAIEDEIANESIVNPTQPNNLQSNRHLQCPYCSKSFDRKYNFEQHVRVHTGERPFACEQCGKAFRQKGYLTQHQLLHQNIKRFQCDQCDKQFVLKIKFDFHLRRHSGERPYKCNFCDKCFTESGQRSRHEQAKHLHVKPYRCKVCGLTATLRANVIVHIRVVHFGLPASLKQQRERNIIDDRDPGELVEKVLIE